MKEDESPTIHDNSPAKPADGPAAPVVTLELPPYLLGIRDFIKRSDTEVWSWFASQRHSPKLAEEVRFDLLKSTYRVEREMQPQWYSVADEVQRRLDIRASLTIYQAQNPEGLNASLAYVPGEVHLILHGAVANQLRPDEFRAVVAHELAHYKLWERDQGEFLIVADVLHALVTDPHAHPAHFASWRLLRLYTEIFCDRTALAINGDIHCVVTMLVKMTMGVAEVSPESFLRQAEEIFSRDGVKTEGITHPEAYIRARAIRLHGQRQPDCERQIVAMIEGQPGIDEIDLLEQERIADFTRRVLDLLLHRKWFQTDPAIAHARLFFDGYQPPSDPVVDGRLAEQLRTQPESMRDYYCFLLLDFAAIDRDLEELPLAAALAVAQQLNLKPRLLELARKELKLRKNQLEKIDNHREQLLADADREVGAA